jgi:3-oxoisoapionate decarboxylase
MRRRHFLTSLVAICAAKSLLQASEFASVKVGMCSFSCHRHWQAVRDRSAPTKFQDALGFYDYSRQLGGDGVQTSVASWTADQAKDFRAHVEATGGYYEGDLRLPNRESELESFESDVKISLQAGASVGRACLMGSRRYETWKKLEDFEEFRRHARKRLGWIEPILRRHRYKIAIENHKDLTSDELVEILGEISSEWIGVNVDTGNNIALLEDPYETMETLAPFAMSVHLKDMAVQPDSRGFKLSEVPCGTGCLDLQRIARTLIVANPSLCFSLEMATRDPLVIPCLEDSYWISFPERRTASLERMMKFVSQHQLRQPPPTIRGKAMSDQLQDEENNNRESLLWMKAKA